MNIEDLIDAHRNGKLDELGKKLDIHPGWLSATIHVLRRLGYNIPSKRRPLKAKTRTPGSRIWWQDRGF